MSPLIHGFCGPGRQRGAIGLMAAVTFALAVLCMLLVIDSGRLYLEKRSLQRVADVSALEAATRAGQCSPTSTAPGYAIAAATRNGFTVTDATRTLATDCGTLIVGANNQRTFNPDATQNQAIRVVVTHSVARSIAAGVAALFPGGTSDPNIDLSATAVAAKGLPPLASLTIRSTLLTVDSSKSAALNALFGGLLGGNLNLSVAGWQGLADSNINLLSYLNQLAIDTHVAAGDFTTLLTSNITLTQLLSTAATVLPQNGPTAQAAINGLASIQAIAGSTTVQLQNLLNLQTGTPTAGLNLNMNLFQLIEGEVQLANSQSALSAALQTNVLGLANITTKLKVIEPPQLSAVGDPRIPNQIYVRTAQVRALITVDLGALGSTLTTVLNIATTALKPVTALLGGDLQIAPDLNFNISVEAASADSHVTGFTCDSAATKTLSVLTNTAAVKLQVGKFDSTAWNSATQQLPPPGELVLINIRTGTPRKDFGGGGLGLIGGSTSILASSHPFTFNVPANIGLPPAPYHSFNSDSDIVASLAPTLNSIQVVSHQATDSGLLSILLKPIFILLGPILDTAVHDIGLATTNILSPLLDPILNLLLQTLGIDLAKVDVGANLSCSTGQAALVI